MTESNGHPPILRVIYWNLAILAGIVLGFLGVSRLPSGNATARIAIFWLACVNLVLFVVKPRLTASGRNNDFVRASWHAIAERPIVSLVVVMQLWSAGQALGSAITLASTYRSEAVVSQHLQSRLVLVSILMSVIGVVWLIGAFALWQQKRWGWWLAVILNGLSACTGIFAQVAALTVLKRNDFLVDPVAITTVIVLLMTRTRLIFGLKAAPRLDAQNA